MNAPAFLPPSADETCSPSCATVAAASSSSVLTVEPAAAHRPVIQLLGVDKAFGPTGARTIALRSADFSARAGELTLLVGPSGCGKTTLVSILAGTLHPDAGQVEVLGRPLHSMSQAALTRFRREHVGFIFQQFNLIPTLTVWENVALPLLIQGRSARSASRAACDLLARVGLGGRENERPARLSGGQQQRVAIARALIHEPPLLVCDEPTSALDRESGRLTMELIATFARSPGRCVIIVTHDPRIYGYADRMVEMEDGRVTRLLATRAEIAAAHPAALAPPSPFSPFAF